jgi:hypothetical protein
MRLILTVAAICLAVAPASAQTILGGKLDFKEKPGFPTSRQLKVKSQEKLSPEVIDGDPATNGAVVTILLNGATSTTQTINLPAGARWRRSPSNTLYPVKGWKYKESLRLGFVSPVATLQWAKSGSGTFKLAAAITGKYVPLTVTAPNPGTYAGLVISIPGGPTYCTNFGGAAGGVFLRNDALYLRIAKPTAEGVCPSGTPVCGDDIIDAPFETCDGSNDAACPGLCGANGFACLCPFCGDATIDPGEACDTNAHPGSCTEGCSYACQCAQCGNGVVDAPSETCEPDDPFACGGEGTCWPVGSPSQCECPFCGDGAVNVLGEECEAGDDSACPGFCNASQCRCPSCGNGEVEGTEECDGSSSPCGDGDCLSDCTCSVCGDGVVEGPEECEAADDSNCPGRCVAAYCGCSVCGDDFQEGSEACDGTDDSACPGSCQPDCTCP